MADEAETPFRMVQAREAISRGWTHIERQVTAAENAVHDEPTHAFDLARALIESTCRRILRDRGISYSTNDELIALFNKVSQNLAFLPPEASHETAARRSLERTLSGLRTVVQGTTELRNEYGFASHGHEADIPEMEQTQAILVAGAADVIIGFLYRIHTRDRTADTTSGPSLYEQNQEFNDSIDETHEIYTVLDVEFWPSEVLFQMEPETYRLHLAEFMAEAEGPEEIDA